MYRHHNHPSVRVQSFLNRYLAEEGHIVDPRLARRIDEEYASAEDDMDQITTTIVYEKDGIQFLYECIDTRQGDVYVFNDAFTLWKDQKLIVKVTF